MASKTVLVTGASCGIGICAAGGRTLDRANARNCRCERNVRGTGRCTDAAADKWACRRRSRAAQQLFQPRASIWPLPPATQALTSASRSSTASYSLDSSTSVVRPAEPRAAVQDFYARVAAHDFDAAAASWSPRMRAAYPPAQNIDQGFSGTRAVTVQRADVVWQTTTIELRLL
jgi:hypothetical protein